MPPDARRWYAVQTLPAKERLAVRCLTGAGIETFWPNYLAAVRIGTRRGYALRSWLPRYLFVAEGPSFSMHRINTTLGVSSLVMMGEELLAVPFDVVLDLKSYADPMGTIAKHKLAPSSMVEIRGGQQFVRVLDQLRASQRTVWIKGMQAAAR